MGRVRLPKITPLPGEGIASVKADVRPLLEDSGIMAVDVAVTSFGHRSFPRPSAREVSIRYVYWYKLHPRRHVWLKEVVDALHGGTPEDHDVALGREAADAAAQQAFDAFAVGMPKKPLSSYEQMKVDQRAEARRDPNLIEAALEWLRDSARSAERDRALARQHGYTSRVRDAWTVAEMRGYLDQHGASMLHFRLMSTADKTAVTKSILDGLVSKGLAERLTGGDAVEYAAKMHG